MRWREKERNFVDSARVARLATVDSNGTPHNIPICPLLHNDKIYFGTGASAKKVLNLKNNPNVALVFDDYTEAWEHLRGIMIQGRARVMPSKRFRALRKKLYTKYLQFPLAFPLPERSTAIVEVVLQKKFSWGLE